MGMSSDEDTASKDETSKSEPYGASNKFTNHQIELLLTAVKESGKFLYLKSANESTTRERRNIFFACLAKKISTPENPLTGQDLKNKWRQMKGNYFRARRGYEKVGPSGFHGPPRKNPTWQWFALMNSFLGTVKSLAATRISNTVSVDVISTESTTESNLFFEQRLSEAKWLLPLKKRNLHRRDHPLTKESTEIHHLAVSLKAKLNRKRSKHALFADVLIQQLDEFDTMITDGSLSRFVRIQIQQIMLNAQKSVHARYNQN